MKEQINKILNLTPERIWPFAIVITGLMLSASITFASFTLTTRKEVIVEKPIETKAVLGLETSSPTPEIVSSIIPLPPAPIIIPTPKPSTKPTPVPSPSSVAASQQNNPTSQTNNPVIIQVIATPTPSPSQTPTPEPSPSINPSPSPVAQKISIEIKQPDTQINFDLEITEGINPCQALQKAKDEGKINSLTISDKYLASFGTLLVEEINGYKNNWVFTVNGQSPNGCSLITLKNGDKVIWEFLNL